MTDRSAFADINIGKGCLQGNGSILGCARSVAEAVVGQ
jgi:hypothetical protein